MDKSVYGYIELFLNWLRPNLRVSIEDDLHTRWCRDGSGLLI